MASQDASDYVALGGKTRRYLDSTTGETISRRQYDRRFRLGPRGLRSYEELARKRASPMRRTIDTMGRVARRVLGGESLPQAAKAEGISVATARRFNRQRRVLAYDRRSGRWQVWTAGTASFFDAHGVLHQHVPFDQHEIHTLSAYGQAVYAAKHGRGAALRSFRGVTVRDVFGNEYTLLTDIDAYLRQEQRYSFDPMDFFKSGETLISGPTGAAA